MEYLVKAYRSRFIHSIISFIMPNKLKCGVWNIHGYKSQTLGNKLSLLDVQTFASSYDILGLVETHADQNSNLEIKNYKCYTKNRSRIGSKNSGGLAIYISRKFINKGISYFPTKSENIIWCRIDKKAFNLAKDIFLGTTYLSPRNYENTHNLDLINELEQEISQVIDKGDIIIQGDLNARTGEAQEYVDLTDSKFLNVPDNDMEDLPKIQRRSEDKIIDHRGKSLIDLCTANDLMIVNGRKIGDFQGKKTCFQYNGSSMVDYIIVNINLFKEIKYLKVEELKPHLSDHCAVTYMLHCNETTTTVPKTPATKIKTFPHKNLIWNNDAESNLKEILQSTTVQQHLNNIVENYDDSYSTSKMTEDFTEVLINASRKAGIKYQTSGKKQNNSKQNQAWFDKECIAEKHKLIAAGKKLTKDPKITEIRNKFFLKKKQFKTLCRKKKTNYMNDKIKELDFSDSKSVWKNLKSLFKITKQKDKPNKIEIEDLYTHFKNQNDVRSIIEQNFDSVEVDDPEGPLDYDISTEELAEAFKKLKTRKAAGNDLILNEMLIAGRSHLEEPLLKLLNRIIKSGVFPESWSTGHIIPIHKKGDPSKPENYRGITLLSLLSKILTSILNHRLYNYLSQKGILKQEQCGFRKSQGTADCIYILKTLIEKYVKKRSCKTQNLLFSCFIDFQKAFDCIPRDKLFAKLRNNGITGKFYSLLRSMYTSDKSCIKQDNILTETFPCHTGVKQGCMLSPTLFNLFLSDLPQALTEHSTHLVEINSSPINCLIYADDLIIFSKSAEGLQQLLNKLEEYSNKQSISVNIEKTKIMIFNNQGKRMNKYHFH